MMLVGVLRYSMRVSTGVCPGGHLVPGMATGEVAGVGAGDRTERRSGAPSGSGRTRSGREAVVGGGGMVGGRHHLIALGLGVVGWWALLRVG